MKPNPFQSPNGTKEHSAPICVSQESSVTPLGFLVGIAILTLLLAWIDALQTGVSGVGFILEVTFGAIIAQLPGLFCGEMYRRSGTRYSFIFLVPAFFIAVCSLLVYGTYVLTGLLPSIDSTENAGQMHVIFMPFLLGILSLVAYAIGGVAAGIVASTHRNAG